MFNMNTIELRKTRLMWLAVGCLALGACQQPTNTPVASKDLQDLKSDIVIYGMTSYLTDRGIRQGQIKADTAYVYQDSSFVKMRGMHVVFYGKDGQERATVAADSGSLHQRSQRMEARGNVVLIVAADHRKVQSAELNYDPDRDQIWSDSATVMTLGSQVTRGTSFRSDLEFKNVQVQNPRGAVGGDVF